MYAPTTEPAVAEAAYSYQSGRWLAARIAVRMSGPANVGTGELSRIARENRPAAPRCRNVVRSVGCARRVCLCRRKLNTLAIYQAGAARTQPAFFTRVVSNSRPSGLLTNIFSPSNRTGTVSPAP